MVSDHWWDELEEDEPAELPYHLHFFAEHAGSKYALKLSSASPWQENAPMFMGLNCFSHDDCVVNVPVVSPALYARMMAEDEDDDAETDD